MAFHSLSTTIDIVCLRPLFTLMNGFGSRSFPFHAIPNCGYYYRNNTCPMSYLV